MRSDYKLLVTIEDLIKRNTPKRDIVINIIVRRNTLNINDEGK